jgi:type I restriction enzyme M protein
MIQQELEKYLWGAAIAQRGTIDAGDYKQYIFPLFFFNASVMSTTKWMP